MVESFPIVFATGAAVTIPEEPGTCYVQPYKLGNLKQQFEWDGDFIQSKERPEFVLDLPPNGALRINARDYSSEGQRFSLDSQGRILSGKSALLPGVVTVPKGEAEIKGLSTTAKSAVTLTVRNRTPKTVFVVTRVVKPGEKFALVVPKEAGNGIPAPKFKLTTKDFNVLIDAAKVRGPNVTKPEFIAAKITNSSSKVVIINSSSSLGDRTLAVGAETSFSTTKGAVLTVRGETDAAGSSSVLFCNFHDEIVGRGTLSLSEPKTVVVWDKITLKVTNNLPEDAFIITDCPVENTPSRFKLAASATAEILTVTGATLQAKNATGNPLRLVGGGASYQGSVPVTAAIQKELVIEK